MSITKRIAEVFEAHQVRSEGDWDDGEWVSWVKCSCDNDAGNTDVDEHARHVARMITPLFEECAEAVQRVRDLHARHECEHGSCVDHLYCSECLDEYPCGTIRALDGD